jgi:hypothetical protein
VVEAALAVKRQGAGERARITLLWEKIHDLKTGHVRFCPERSPAAALHLGQPDADLRVRPSDVAASVQVRDQVVDRRREGEHPPDAAHAPMPGLSQQGDRLRPAEDLLHQLAVLRLRRELGTGIPGGAPVTLRITVDQDSGVQVVRLDGWLEGEVLVELERLVSGRSSKRSTRRASTSPTGRSRCSCRRGRRGRVVTVTLGRRQPSGRTAPLCVRSP